ncbi:hypothetical protein D1007_34496 [Hordeum vulgare]|nr:hypothetical protein D1007_34496 [Hordeum vulgare]
MSQRPRPRQPMSASPWVKPTLTTPRWCWKSGVLCFVKHRRTRGTTSASSTSTRSRRRNNRSTGCGRGQAVATAQNPTRRWRCRVRHEELEVVFKEFDKEEDEVYDKDEKEDDVTSSSAPVGTTMMPSHSRPAATSIMPARPGALREAR